LGVEPGEEAGYGNEVCMLYEDFAETQKTPAKIYITTHTTAEMVKYMGNCLLASKVIFCNEMYQICHESQIDYKEVARLVSLDKRIGPSHMQVPGPDGKFGTSGKCFPKDMNSLIWYAKSIGVDPLVLEALWTKNLLVREDHDWEDIPGATTANMNFEKK
jgi:UDPglucose 6-dehydrogenase